MYDMQTASTNKNTKHAYSACAFSCASSASHSDLYVIAVRIALAVCIFVISVVLVLSVLSVLSVNLFNLVIMISIINLIIRIMQSPRDKKHVWIPTMYAG